MSATTRPEATSHSPSQRSSERPDRGFTPQQSKVANLVARGMTDREIASTIHVSTWTVRYHLRRIFVKFGLTHRSQVVWVCLANRDREGPGGAGRAQRIQATPRAHVHDV